WYSFRPLASTISPPSSRNSLIISTTSTAVRSGSRVASTCWRCSEKGRSLVVGSVICFLLCEDTLSALRRRPDDVAESRLYNMLVPLVLIAVDCLQCGSDRVLPALDQPVVYLFV